MFQITENLGSDTRLIENCRGSIPSSRNRPLASSGKSISPDSCWPHTKLCKAIDTNPNKRCFTNVFIKQSIRLSQPCQIESILSIKERCDLQLFDHKCFYLMIFSVGCKSTIHELSLQVLILFRLRRLKRCGNLIRVRNGPLVSPLVDKQYTQNISSLCISPPIGRSAVRY